MGALILKERRQSLERRVSSCVFGIVTSLRVPGASRQANADQKASRDILYRSHRHYQTCGNLATRNRSVRENRIWIAVYTEITPALYGNLRPHENSRPRRLITVRYACRTRS